jgi:hypothetical protein
LPAHVISVDIWIDSRETLATPATASIGIQREEEVVVVEEEEEEEEEEQQYSNLIY